jgi:hypothetical protein
VFSAKNPPHWKAGRAASFVAGRADVQHAAAEYGSTAATVPPVDLSSENNVDTCSIKAPTTSDDVCFAVRGDDGDNRELSGHGRAIYSTGT